MAESKIERSDAGEPEDSGFDGSEKEFPVLVHASHSYQGPLPPAHELAKYEEIQPGLAQNIVDMAQKEQTFRHETTKYEQETERLFLRHAAIKTYIGQAGAFALTSAALAGSFWLINNGHSAGGIAGIVSALTALAAVFIVGKRSESHEEPEPDDSDSE